MRQRPGRHFLQIPGPTNVPERIQRAMLAPVIDHRGPDFAELAVELLARLKGIFQTRGDVVIYPGSGTGAWEASLVNTLCPGDGVLMYETGQFALQWQRVAREMGLDVQWLAGDWRRGVDAEAIGAALERDTEHRIRAVAVVHNETSTGVVSSIPRVRAALDRARHPALLLVDCISSLGSLEYRHDEWGVDVSVAASQKGLMLPPGLALNAISAKARAAQASAKLPRAYWNWQPQLEGAASGSFPYTPATSLLFGLREALDMLEEEGLPRVFARHARLAEATRRAVRGWGLELQPLDPAEYSDSLTAVRMPAGCDADALRAAILEQFDLSLGAGLGQLRGQVFRIGHLGDLNELSLAATLCGVEMGLASAAVPHTKGGVLEALAYLGEQARAQPRAEPAGPGR